MGFEFKAKLKNKYLDEIETKFGGFMYSFNVTFKKCILGDLKLSGKDFTLKDAVVKGNIKAISISGWGRLVLDNTIVVGNAEFHDGDILCVNAGAVENNQE